jgi:diguanylate cyclase (GGDEF)-like protein/PAS domain S-box-containing protein
MKNKKPKKGGQAQETIYIDYLMLLNQNLMLSIPANFLCTLIVFIGLFHVASPKILFIWFISSIAAFFLNTALFFVNRFYAIKPQLYLNLLIGITITYGALWGIVGSALIPYHDLLNQMLVISIIIGVASGGLHILQPNRTASLLFFILTILPLSFWLFYQDLPTYILLGSALLVYFCFMLTVSWMGYGFLNNNLNLRYENLALINQLMKINMNLEESESRFRSAFDSSAIGMALVSTKGTWLKVNEALCQLVGYTKEELLNSNIQTITYPEDTKLGAQDEQQLLAGAKKFYHVEKRYMHKSGKSIWVSLSCSLIRDRTNNPQYFIVQIQNINAQKHAQHELKYIAYHDVLTGLANRKQLDKSFEAALAYAKLHSKEIAVLFIDLDYFKEVNDQLGHDVGDQLLIEIAKRLKSTLRATDIVSRQGGDEFIVVLTALTHGGQATECAQTLLHFIAKPIAVNQHEISITASIGISCYPRDGEDLYTLIKSADESLYYVKSTGKNNFHLSKKKSQEKLCNKEVLYHKII